MSRILGFTREMLWMRYLGVGAISDAFLTAFRIPNMFRHIFAEGALNASFVPVIVKTVKEGNKEEANGLLTVSFLFFQAILLVIYAFIFFKTELIIKLIAPGFSAEQTNAAVPLLRILFPLIMFFSGSALIGGALNSVNHFFIPAFSMPLLNVIIIATIFLCMGYALAPNFLCWGILIAAGVQFLLHLVVYFKNHFRFGHISVASFAAFKTVLWRFLPALFGAGIFEFNVFISMMIASFLPQGSMTLLHLASRMMNIPLGIFAVALSSVLLPHFSRVVLYAPKRLPFYLLEVVKFICWIVIPATFFLAYISEPIFKILLGSKATPDILYQGKWVLVLYVIGLLPLSINKTLVSIFYAKRDTRRPAIASGISAGVNIIGDVIGMYFFGVYGIALANTVAAFVMMFVCFIFLHKYYEISLYVKRFWRFIWRYIVQMLCIVTVLFAALMVFERLIHGSLRAYIGVWPVAITAVLLFMGLVFVTRQRFGVRVYFLRK
jgi:putative peptidoglycan lipid II flippase